LDLTGLSKNTIAFVPQRFSLYKQKFKIFVGWMSSMCCT